MQEEFVSRNRSRKNAICISKEFIIRVKHENFEKK